MFNKSVLVCIILISSTLGLSIDSFVFISEGASDSDGVLELDTKAVVSGTYNIVRVKSTGHLVIETQLEAAQIFLEAGSNIEITGGELKLKDSDTPGAKVFISGSTNSFKMTNGARIIMDGATGASSVKTSTGGNVELSITVTNNIILENSEIIMLAGKGYTKTTPGAATTSDLMHYQYGGGNATAIFNLSKSCTTSFSDSTIEIVGGAGGKAADGENAAVSAAGKGGGYSNGGEVGGNVGRGGWAFFNVNYDSPLILTDMDISVQGGLGGKAGDAGLTSMDHGTGAGGYSGGDGGYRDIADPVKSAGKDGGDVKDYVGAGGNASILFQSQSSLELNKCSIIVQGGAGGDAGPHKNQSPVGAMGGIGGLGYGGGGGGAGHASVSGTLITAGGDGGTISGHVGSGGSGILNAAVQGEITVKNSLLNISGGRGGNAANGSIGQVGGGGGGGYGGGGGGGGSWSDSGNVSSVGGTGGLLTGFVGAGGDSILNFISDQDIKLWESTFLSTGGSGGKAGQGGKVDGKESGGGGGGYGGGGGGGKNGEWIGGKGGNGGIISGFVGSGGSAYLDFITNNIFEVLDSQFIGSGGSGGLEGGAGTSSSGGDGGGGGGGYGGGGGGGSSKSHLGGLAGIGATGTSTVVSGGVAKYKFQADTYTISQSSIFKAEGGAGGSCSDIPGYSGGSRSSGYGDGGYGNGHTGANGITQLNIPMGTPRLLYLHDNEAVSNNRPTFEWIPQHNSTVFGTLTNHWLEIDDENTFTTPVVIALTKEGKHTLMNPLKDGEYYWRVCAKYGKKTAGWSEPRMFVIDTTPVYYSNLEPSSWTHELSPNCTVDIGDSLTEIDLASIEYSISTTDTMPGSFGDWTSAEGIIDLSGDSSLVRAWTYPVFYAGSNNFIKWRAQDSVGNSYNESPICRAQIDTEAPLVSAISPANNSWISSTHPTFEWVGFDYGSSLSGNCTLQITKYTGTVAGEIVVNLNTSIPYNSSGIFTYQLQGSELDYGSYLWRVKVEDNAGLWSSFSEDIMFNVDTIQPVASGLEPSQAAWVSPNPIFSWHALDTAAGVSSDFELELAYDRNFADLIYHLEGTESDLIQIDDNTFSSLWFDTNPLESGTWFWRIRVMGNEGLWSNYSEPLEFRVDDTPPYIVPVEPFNGSWLGSNPKLVWAASDSESGLSGYYRIELAEEREFIKPVINEILQLDSVSSGDSQEVEVTYEISLNLNKNVYYWRIQAQDSVGLWSAPSDIYEFKIDLLPPKITTLYPHLNGWVGNDLKFIWSGEDTISGLSGEYRIQVAETEDFQDALVDTTISGPKENNVDVVYIPTEGLPEGELYWRVSAKDNSGNWCPYTQPQWFNLDLTKILYSEPLNYGWFNTEEIIFEIELSDEGAGVESERIYYRFSSTGISTYGPWMLVPDISIYQISGKEVRVSIPISCKEGLGNYVQFKARDLVNDVYQESPNYRLSIDLSAVSYSDPSPTIDSWQNNPVVTCSVNIFDLYSGVDISTLEYRISTSGPDEFGEWMLYNNSFQYIPSGEFVVRVDAAFNDGENNYIQWRVKDNAGNGYFSSDAYQVKVLIKTQENPGERLDPPSDDAESGPWSWITSMDMLFILRLIVIIIIFSFLIGMLRRQRKRPNFTEKQMDDYEENSGGGKVGPNKLGRFNKGRSNGSSKNDDNSGDLEEMMTALDNELKGKFSSSTSAPSRNGVLDRTVIHVPASTLGPMKPSSKPPVKALRKKGNGSDACEICKGHFKTDSDFKNCDCGKRYHKSCSERRKNCLKCGRKL